MSIKKSPAGNPSAIPLSLTPAAQGSSDARVARAGEPGAEPGAAPSNTAPHNDKTTPVDAFRLLRLAVDSLYLSFPGDLRPEVLAALSTLKTKAQSEHPELQAQAQYVVGRHIFEVKDKGARMFPFVLEDNAYRLQLSKPGKKLPMAYVKVSAEYLAHKGPVEVHQELQELLAEFGDVSGSGLVSRIDLAADFVSSIAMDSWPRTAWVTRATQIHSYAKDQVFTGWAIGMGGVISARLYNKVEEILYSGKPWVMNLWEPAGWTPGEPVWRLEFELKRDFLKEKGLSSLDSVLEHLNGLWSYATTEWLRLTVPNEADTVRGRWPIHPLWVALASVDWESTGSAKLERFSNARTPSEQRLAVMVMGSLVSYMAMHGLDDHNEAIEALLHVLHENFSVLADKKGMTFEELLSQRVALKAREFNTGINEPGLAAALKKASRDAGPDAYRRASRGE